MSSDNQSTLSKVIEHGINKQHHVIWNSNAFGINDIGIVEDKSKFLNFNSKSLKLQTQARIFMFCPPGKWKKRLAWYQWKRRSRSHIQNLSQKQRPCRQEGIQQMEADYGVDKRQLPSCASVKWLVRIDENTNLSECQLVVPMLNFLTLSISLIAYSWPHEGGEGICWSFQDT